MVGARIHHLAENESRLWVAHFTRSKVIKEMCFGTTIAFSLTEHVGHVPGEDRCTVSHRKTPGFADRLDCSGRGRVTHWVWGNEPHRPNSSLSLLSLSLSLGIFQAHGEPKVWPAPDHVAGNFSRGDAYWCPGLGLHRGASRANLIRQLYHIFLFSSSSQPAAKPKPGTTNPV